MVTMIPVKSSNIKAIGWKLTRLETEKGTEFKVGNMRVQFTRGAVYDYPNILEHDYDLFLNSKSKGKFFHKNFSMMPCVRII